MSKFGIEAPWYAFQKKVKALFEKDPEIVVGEVYKVENEEGMYAFDIEVMNHQKFIALDRLLPGVKMFGNVGLSIVLYDEENSSDVDLVELYETVFKGNPIVKAVQSRPDVTGTKWNYVQFVPEVVQFFDDNLRDYDGNWTGLAEDIAREVFAENSRGVNFCTAPKEGVEKPLGEWP